MLDSIVEALARWTALAGGFALICVVVMSCVSIVGRALGKFGFGLGPIQGDFELVEIGIGFAIFAFLPWCQLRRAHASVDLFQRMFGPILNRVIDIVADGLMLIIAALIAWRMWLGMLDKKSYTETTFILEFPVWISYGAAMIGASVFVVVAAFCVARSGRVLLGLADD